MEREPTLFDPPPRDKQAALERAAAVAGVTPAQLKQRAAIVDAQAIDPAHQRPRPRRKPWGRKGGAR